ncbi:protein FAM3A isoform X2 [Salvelinus sp. IW2-2015]|uniref:protein FAM3A isoform X2 n=1 Tax=Salvelinus sp. IW2-2015 TaxID=2691554 RepID=UPI000CDFC19D|nr:protein FAM3A isoform X2 [Salvelinus alpinus]
MRLAGPMRVVAVLLLLGLTWVLASSILGGDSRSLVKHFFSGTNEAPTAETKPRRYKCGLSAPCPQKHLAFRLVSGAANVIGPKICLEDKILVSSVKNNVGRGLNIALVNGVSGELLETKSFDMWAGDVTDLLKYLRPLHEGTLVFVASFDDPATKLNDEARRLFEELGSTAVKELTFRDSWVFVGAKGIENKSPFEQRMKNSKSSNKYEGWPESLEMDGCIPLRAPLEN